MFKFLVYLFLFYSVTRFIFGTLLNFNKNAATTPNNDIKEEEEIKIKNTANSSAQQKTKSKNSNIGEYVDFEEIK